MASRTVMAESGLDRNGLKERQSTASMPMRRRTPVDGATWDAEISPAKCSTEIAWTNKFRMAVGGDEALGHPDMWCKQNIKTPRQHKRIN